MTKNQVKIGETYEAKVGARWVPVTIVGTTPKGSWNAKSVASGKPIKVKDAKYLRPSEESAEADTGATAGQGEDVVPVTEAMKPKAKTPRATKATSTQAAAPTKLSCLDAAAAVLKSAARPMQCKAMIDAMREQNLWTTSAPTPAATLYSAILREMKTKGDKTRFKKTERGHFVLVE